MQNNIAFSKINTTSQIQIYPNPNYNNNISIEFSEYNNQNYTIRIVDLLGKELFKTSAYGAKHEINSSQIPEGMYIISIESEGVLLKKEKLIIVK
ncbi:MAG: T9SS type A sorting domain-containing protein [Bacteroidia bacterium]